MNLKKILLFLNILLSGLVLWMGFNLYETWASYHKREKKPMAASRETGGSERPNTRKAEKQSDYRLIVSRDIFKTKAAPSKVKENPDQKQKLEELKENTRFELMGTVVGEDGNSFAIIREKNKKEQEIYALGDFVEDAKIAKILSDRVIVKRGGTAEVLVISHERGAAPRSLTPAGRKIVRPPQRTQTVSKRPIRSRTRPVRRPVRVVKPEEPVNPEEPGVLDSPDEPGEPDS